MSIQDEQKTLLGADRSTDSENQTSCICSKRTLKICCLPLILLIIAISCGMFFTFYLSSHHGMAPLDPGNNCRAPCVISLVETIPEGLNYSENATMHLSTGHVLIDLIANAEKTIDVASYYWSLLGKDISYHDNSSKLGEDLFYSLLDAGKNRNIPIRIVQNLPSKDYPDNDTRILAEQGHANVRSINFTKLVGAGILHTKMWLIDGQHFYVGSANTDWRSMTQVKEMGVVVKNCSCLANDMMKIFEVYWLLANKNNIPKPLPKEYDTTINDTSPEFVEYNGTHAHIYLSSSPPNFCPKGRTSDIDSILSVISQARFYIYIAVMDYFPTTLYNFPRQYWPIIDDALREAAFHRRVRVRVMASNWTHTRPDMYNFLHSLQAISDKYVNVKVKTFHVPTYTESQAKIPFCRVNHNKYMVTDQHAYIGTSNWSGDYFENTGGIGFVLNTQNANKTSQDIRLQLKDVFNRDWHSPYAHNLTSSCHNNTHHHDEL